MGNEAEVYWARRWTNLALKPKLYLVVPGRRIRTHCHRGHSYAKHGEVRFWGGANVRVCRICRANSNAKYWRKVSTGWRKAGPWEFVGKKKR